MFDVFATPRFPADPRIALPILAMLVAAACWAEEPLHRRIDRFVDAQNDGESAPRSSDAEFFRRLHLDLAGRIPAADATRKFLEDPSPTKREEAIDRLLDSPAYARRMANLFDVMLMERRGENEEWFKFLKTCFERNMPWDGMVREILKPDREDEALRGAAYFYTRRLEKVGQQATDFPGLTRDVGRLFLGVDLQCAECHDHLFIDDYKQREFQGLFAVYRNVSIRKEAFPAINEKAMTEKLEFLSVFEDGKNATGPRIPFGQEFEIPEPPKPDPAVKKKRRKPDPNAPPAFSALGLISQSLPSAESPLFRKNIANRLWFVMMGRGLIEPLDQFHSENPPTHPELLELLGDELAARDFDIRWMIRELALTETWQRSSRWTSADEPPSASSYRLAAQRRLTAEQIFWSTLQATGNLERLAPKDDGKPSEAFKSLEAAFRKAFASEAKEPATDYAPAVKQALFFLNDARVLGLFELHSSNLIDRLTKTPDDRVAETLFLSIFCRMPDEPERKQVEAYLAQRREDRTRALGQLAWAMLSSMEFCVNH